MLSKLLLWVIALGLFSVGGFFINQFGEYALASTLLGGVVATPLLGGMAVLVATRFRSVVRVNLASTMILSVAAIYAFEAFLQMGWYRPAPEIKLGEPGRAFDRMNHMEVVRNLRDQGRAAFPSVFSRGLLVYRGATTRSALGALLPLGGISDVETVACNETGEFLVYRSDEKGFNNPKGPWNADAVEILAVGDSFTQGHCVDNGSNFVAKIREHYPRTVNLGMSSNGPLAELAGIREYIGALKLRVVLWFYYEENDLSEDLPIEEKVPILLGYLEKDGVCSRSADSS